MTKVVFFGNERLVSGLNKTAAPILTGLIDGGYDVVAVVSHHTLAKSRNDRGLEVGEIAKKHNIPLLLPAKPSEITTQLKELQADVAVLVAYGRIISQEVINIFPHGIINIHPSLLPNYRGPTPIEAALLNGDPQTGVSIMQLTAGMDEGPVYAQESFSLTGSEDKFDLYEKITDITTPLFFDVFPKIVDGSLQPTPQDNNAATYCKLIEKKDSYIDWEKPAVELEREVRAYLGWPQSRTRLGGIEVIITKAHIQSGVTPPGEIVFQNDKTLSVGTGKDLLTIDSLKPPGKKEMPISAFLSGYKNQLNY
ncbi:methionyl-tRNA formyltransferase [Candidatus Saccharibacteria bacterium]|nr:methionyl-tRNA formyltransferase [Candidatus Saccharibacteria bacterium]